MKEKIKEVVSKFGIIGGITLVTIVVVFSVNIATGWGPGGDKAPGGANAPKPTTSSDTELPATSTGGSSSSDGTSIPGGSYTTDENGNLVDENGNPAPAGLTSGGSTTIEDPTGSGAVSGQDMLDGTSGQQ